MRYIVPSPRALTSAAAGFSGSMTRPYLALEAHRLSVTRGIFSIAFAAGDGELRRVGDRT